MCKEDKMLRVASEMFKNENMSVSIGMLHPQSKEVTVLLGGRVEFNSYKHRRDAFDVMEHFGLWFKRSGDQYIAGVHGESECSTGKSAPIAVTNAAYDVTCRI